MLISNKHAEVLIGKAVERTPEQCNKAQKMRSGSRSANAMISGCHETAQCPCFYHGCGGWYIGHPWFTFRFVLHSQKEVHIKSGVDVHRRWVSVVASRRNVLAVVHYFRNGYRNSGYLIWFRNPEIHVRNPGNLGFRARNSGNDKIRILNSGSNSVRDRNSVTHTIKTRNSGTHTSRSRNSYMQGDDILVYLLRFSK